MRIDVATIVERDLDDIVRFIARHNPRRARTFVDELRVEFTKIGQNPMSYRLRPEVAPDARLAVYGKYLILFRVEGDLVQIRRVIHGARDLRGRFR